MTRSRRLQFIVLAPILALMVVAGGALYFLVLRTVGDYADASIRANLDSLARSAFAIADAEVDRQNREGRAGDEQASLPYELNARIRFEDFAREHEIGLMVEVDGVVDFVTGMKKADWEVIPQLVPTVGTVRLRLPNGEESYVRPISFAPWNWRLILVKDATAFEILVAEVRNIYAGSALALLLITLLLVVWIRQALVRPIYRIARDFGEGRAPGYQGIKELEFLSSEIGGMMGSLKAKTLHLETTLQSMSDGIAVFDAEMRLVAWNEQYVRLYRYPPDLIRPGVGFADIMRYNIDRGDYGPGDVEAQLAEIVERARNLDPPRFEIDRNDGTSMEVRRAPMPDGGFVTTYTDITDRKQATRMEIANEAKSKFLANMSHDLRKPITAIIEDIRLFLDRPGDRMPDDQRHNLENVQVSSNHLLGMVDELLEMARIEAGQVEVRPEEIAVDLIVGQGLRVIEPVAKAKRISIKTAVEDGLQAVTDPRLLSRILMNLAGNAAEYTDEGSITVCARRRGGTLEISVSDTGVGIPAEKLDVIFEKFQRVESIAGIMKPGMGLGLGLAISREFAHLLGGRLSVESVLGRGTVFTVSVPINFSETKE